MFVKDIERRCGYFCNFRFSPEDLRGVLQILHTPYTALHTLAQHFLVSSCIWDFWFKLVVEGRREWGEVYTPWQFFSLCKPHFTANYTVHSAHCKLHTAVLHTDKAKKGWKGGGAITHWSALQNPCMDEEVRKRCFSIYPFLTELTVNKRREMGEV